MSTDFVVPAVNADLQAVVLISDRKKIVDYDCHVCCRTPDVWWSSPPRGRSNRLHALWHACRFELTQA